MWIGAEKARGYTGHSQARICKFLKGPPGQAHHCKANNKHWEYRLLPHEVVPGYEEEEWVDLGTVHALGDALKGVFVSNMGRIQEGCTPPSLGNKTGKYRSKCLDHVHYMIHELVGWAFFGARPSPEHTMDHIDQTTFDTDGCISNSVSNLREWADKSAQSTTSRAGSKAATSGKPVRVRVKATGAVTDFTDAYSAARALGVSLGFVGMVCNNRKPSTEFAAEYIDEPDLVRVRTKMGPGCKLELVTEVEQWAEIDPADWLEGGKYFCVRGVAHKRKDPSTHVVSAINQQKRGRRE
jgi:hypothetical protein